MKRWIFVPALLGVVLLCSSCGTIKEMQAMKAPRYETGSQKGARYCGECHQAIFRQWQANSRHALANSSGSFMETKRKFEGTFILNATMGSGMCYACHGSPESSEGVTCEVCHGLASPGVPIEQAHAEKYKPGLVALQQADFCAKCHEMKNPMSGSSIMSLYSEWRRSGAAAKNITCQGCHMAPGENGLRHHGFDSAVRNSAIYRDKLAITQVTAAYPRLSLAIENRVTGHAIPASCGTRLLALEVTFFASNGEVVHRIVETFTKKNDLMGGVMPYKTIGNTQLQSGETRHLSFPLPPRLRGKAARAVLVLRFYEVPDEHRGDLAKAAWVGEPVLTREAAFQDPPSPAE